MIRRYHFRLSHCTRMFHYCDRLIFRLTNTKLHRPSDTNTVKTKYLYFRSPALPIHANKQSDVLLSRSRTVIGLKFPIAAIPIGSSLLANCRPAISRDNILRFTCPLCPQSTHKTGKRSRLADRRRNKQSYDS